MREINIFLEYYARNKNRSVTENWIRQFISGYQRGHPRICS